MKIGLIGIKKLDQEKHFLIIHDSLEKHLYGIFSHSEEILPICSKYNIKHFQSTNELFEKVEAIYFAGSIKPNLDFAVNALKNSCHLFIEDISELDISEIKHIYKLAFEANVTIQLKLTKSFSPEYIEAGDHLNNPKLIEISSNFSKRIRHDDYFIEIINNLNIANKEIKTSIKKISSLALPIDNNHFSLVHIRLDFDNGAILNMKFNNISNDDDDIIHFYTKQNAIEINFSKQYSAINSLESGQVVREELKIPKDTARKSEIKSFISECQKTKNQNISDSPEELKIIQATHEIIEKLNQSAQ